MLPDAEKPSWEVYKEKVIPLKIALAKKKRPKKIEGAISAPSPKKGPKIEASESTLSSKTERALQKGEIKPEAKCDLHGKTQKEAHKDLILFIEKARSSGKRALLVITGKGKEGNSVLRTNAPRWCEVSPLSAHILAVRPAAIQHGGEGAFYVLLMPAKRLR